MKGIRNALLIWSLFTIQVTNVHADVNSTIQYYPIVDGATWTYSNNTGTQSRRVIEQIEAPTSQATFIEVETEGNVITKSWLSNDGQGLRLHKQTSYPSETGSGVDTVVYTPALKLLPATWSSGDTFTFTGNAQVTFPGFAPISLSYTVRTTVGNEGNISVPAGNFSVIPFTYKLTLSGTAFGESVNETNTISAWLAKGVGTVKGQGTIAGSTRIYSLTSWQIPGTREKSHSIYWRNKQTGTNWYYQMNGKNVSKSHAINQIKDANWKIVAIADFNGDGEDDLFWRHQVSGKNWMYLMQNGKVQQSSLVNQVEDLNWVVVGAGDLNGDGKADVILRHMRSGINWLYTMDGKNIAASKKINQVSLDWNIAGLGDFDNDGQSDILWRNHNTGLNWLYLMNGGSIKASKKLSLVVPGWDVAGIADFDNNGVSDVLWRHSESGLNWLYLMNSTGISLNRRLNVVEDTNWQVQGVGDYDQDGNADIFWRHQLSGKNWMYLMSGQQIKQSSGVNPVPTDWEVQ